MMPPFSNRAISRVCVRELVLVRDPTGRNAAPRGLALKIAVNYLEGAPVSASICMVANLHFTIVALDWLHAAPSADIIEGPWRRPIAHAPEVAPCP